MSKLSGSFKDKTKKEISVPKISKGTASGKISPVNNITPKIPDLVERKTISLYTNELAIIENVKARIYKQTKKMPNDSLAHRVIIQMFSANDPDLISCYEKIKFNDGRRKK